MKPLRTVELPSSLQTFIPWFEGICLENQTFKVPRYYLAATTHNYMLYHLTTIKDPTNALTREFEQLVEQLRPTNGEGLVPMEVVISLIANITNMNHKWFTPANFLDRFTTRTHLPLKGTGSLINERGSFLYAPGEAFEVEPIDVKVKTKNSMAGSNAIHLIVNWGEANGPPIWERFAEAAVRGRISDTVGDAG